MNRLVIVGNGYDLSLNLETSYSDLFYWYFNKVFDSFHLSGEVYRDGLWELKHPGDLPYGFNKNELDHAYRSLLKGRIDTSDNGKSLLLEKIFSTGSSIGWVDIEQAYFDVLSCAAGLDQYSVSKQPNLNRITKVNNELLAITSLLNIYLNDLDFSCIRTYPINWQELKKPFEHTELNRKLRHVPGNNLERLMLLNFNYTPTLNPLIKILKEQHIKPETINIHGELDLQVKGGELDSSYINRSLIFGYGDETIQSYLQLENLNINECLRNIKSFKYLESNNYQRLMNFVDEKPFDVLIAGHSCGISDRVLLKSIFEHSNCMFIKPFIYNKKDGSDDFFDKTAAISRHFDSNQIMREKVSQKTYCPYFDSKS